MLEENEYLKRLEERDERRRKKGLAPNRTALLIHCMVFIDILEEKYPEIHNEITQGFLV